MRTEASDRASSSARPPTVEDLHEEWEVGLDRDPAMREALEQRLVDLLGAASDISSVSPEMMLVLLQNRMRDMDGQINTIMNGLNDRTQRAEQIGQRLSEMRNVQTFLQPHMDSDGNVVMDHPLDQDGFFALCRAAGLSDDEAGGLWASIATSPEITSVRLDSAINMVMPGCDPPMSERLASRMGIDNEIDNLNQDLQDCNRGNELLMIKLQTCMDQRKQALELASNCMNNLSQMLDTPIRHIGS